MNLCKGAARYLCNLEVERGLGITSEVEFPVPEGVSRPKKIMYQERYINRQASTGREEKRLPREAGVQECLGLSKVSWRTKRMPVSMEFSWMTSLSMNLRGGMEMWAWLLHM